MMKKTTPLLLATLAFIAIGCNQKTSKNTSTSSSDQYNYSTGGVQSGSTTGTTTSGSTTGTTTSGSTTGTTTSGTGAQPWIGDFSCNGASDYTGGEDCSGFTNAKGSLPTYQIYMAGQTIWKPGLSWNSGASGPSSYFPSWSSASGVLSTDAVLKLRFRILPQYLPSVGVQGCYNRGPLVNGNYQGADGTVPYKHLKFEVGVVPKVLAQANNFPGEFFQTVEVGDGSGKGIGVCRCSGFVNFSNVIDRSYSEHVIVIRNVSDDLECRPTTNPLTNVTTGCPTKNTKQKHCWGVQMQLQTDQTPYNGI